VIVQRSSLCSPCTHLVRALSGDYRRAAAVCVLPGLRDALLTSGRWLVDTAALPSCLGIPCAARLRANCARSARRV
jgi:hypothetical protein